MPFQDDTGVDREATRNPLAGAFSAFASQVERVVAVNVLWALQLVPAVFMLANSDLPDLIRIVGIVYSAVAFIPATGWLYRMAQHIAYHDFLTVEMGREALREMFLPSFRVLLPLLASVGVLYGLIVWTDQAGLFLLSVVLRVMLLLWLTTSNWWGVVLSDQPEASFREVVRQSVRLVWRYPIGTLLPLGAALITALLGVISIGGIVLAVPVLIALLQTEMYIYLKAKK